MTRQIREDNPFEDAKIAQEWIDAIETEKGGARENEVYPMINNWVNQNHLQTVLEIGAGQGVCSPYVETDYIGVEPSQALIDRASELYPQKKFIRGSSYGLPLEGGSVDGAFSVGVWFHIENLDGAHKELSRVLKSEGKVLIITSNPETHDAWESLFTGTKEGKKLDGEVKLPTGKMTRNVFFLHTKEDIVSSLEKAGFEITSTKNFGYGSENVEDRGLGFWIAIEAQKR
ncbi:MAG: class I SAM-dependent methyltransferase [Candidatus Pacebacteria bacterium]|nr:class I SAM-dependent methyltransferase [Candidatus Paceibacterota bacterium]